MDDWSLFYEPNVKNVERVADMKAVGFMNCITGFDLHGNKMNLEIFGPDETTKHKRLEFLYRPCIPSLDPNNPCYGDPNDPVEMAR